MLKYDLSNSAQLHRDSQRALRPDPTVEFALRKSVLGALDRVEAQEVLQVRKIAVSPRERTSFVIPVIGTTELISPYTFRRAIDHVIQFSIVDCTLHVERRPVLPDALIDSQYGRNRLTLRPRSREESE